MLARVSFMVYSSFPNDLDYNNAWCGLKVLNKVSVQHIVYFGILQPVQ